MDQLAAPAQSETRQRLTIPQETRNWFYCLITVTWRDEQRKRKRTVFEGIVGTRPAAERLAESHFARWKSKHVPEPHPF